MKKIIMLLLIFTFLATTSVFALSINVNTASISQLTKINGIGPVKAQAIVAFCQTDKPCKVAKDLLKVKGIGLKILEKIKASIVFE